MKIVKEVTLPLGWLITAISALVSFTLMIAFWVSAVNYRLERIEEKLGIPAYHTDASFHKKSES